MDEAVTAVRRKNHKEEDKRLIDLDAPNPLATINRSAAARTLKVNVSNVSRILSGQRVPHVVTLKRFADYLGLTLDDFYALLGLDKRAVPKSVAGDDRQ